MKPCNVCYTKKLPELTYFPVHEGSLVCGLSVLSQWCAHFTTQVPKVLVDAFKVREKG